MYCFGLQKDLPPSSAAWKISKSRLQSKLRRFKQSKPIESAKSRLSALLKPLKRRSPSQLRHQGFQVVYVGELFREAAASPAEVLHPPSAYDSKGAEPYLWGVDERAEKFIAMFYEDIKLQRQKSLQEYHEMLLRGAM